RPSSGGLLAPDQQQALAHMIRVTLEPAPELSVSWADKSAAWRSIPATSWLVAADREVPRHRLRIHGCGYSKRMDYVGHERNARRPLSLRSERNHAGARKPP